MRNMLIPIIAALSMRSALCVAALPSGMENGVSPCPVETRTKIRIPRTIPIKNGDFTALHGVIYDRQDHDQVPDKYLVYEPFGLLRKQAYEYTQKTLALVAALGAYCLIDRAGQHTNNFPKYVLLTGILCGLSVAALKYYKFKTNALPAGYIPLDENRAATLKHQMRLPRGVSAKRLCCSKLETGEVDAKLHLDSTTLHTVKLFQNNNSLTPVFAACDDLTARLRKIINRSQLDAWCSQLPTNQSTPWFGQSNINPYDRLLHELSQPVFQPLVNSSPCYVKMLYRNHSWAITLQRIFYGSENFHACVCHLNDDGDIWLPEKIISAFNAAVSGAGFNHQRLVWISEFNRKVRGALGQNAQLVTLYTQKEGIKAAYDHAVALAPQLVDELQGEYALLCS